MLVTGSLLVCLPDKLCLTWLRRIVISIYIYSAVSKFDYQFVFTVGEQMLDVLLGFVGLETTGLPEWLQISLVLCLPMGELLIGGLLLFSRTRKLGGWLAIGLHASLLLVLGPWGLNHQPGVLIWNAWFIVQAWLLFASSKPNENQPASGSEDRLNFDQQTKRTTADTPTGGAHLVRSPSGDVRDRFSSNLRGVALGRASHQGRSLGRLGGLCSSQQPCTYADPSVADFRCLARRTQPSSTPRLNFKLPINGH